MNARMVFAWLTATAVAVVLAYQAVGLVQTQVTDRPPVLAAAELSTTTLGVEDLPPIQPTVTIPDEAEGRVDAPPATVGTQTTASSVPATPTTSSSSSSTTTTLPSPATSVPAITSQYLVQSAGGTVKVFCTGDVIEFGTAWAASGYEYEVRAEGPGEVRVVFEALEIEHEVDMRARCEAGDVVERITEEH